MHLPPKGSTGGSWQASKHPRRPSERKKESKGNTLYMRNEGPVPAPYSGRDVVYFLVFIKLLPASFSPERWTHAEEPNAGGEEGNRRDQQRLSPSFPPPALSSSLAAPRLLVILLCWFPVYFQTHAAPCPRQGLTPSSTPSSSFSRHTSKPNCRVISYCQGSFVSASSQSLQPVPPPPPARLIQGEEWGEGARGSCHHTL